MRLTWQSWSRILKQLAKDAGLGNKRIYNHLLRHSSATANAGFLTESELKLLYGWSGSSKMPAIYVHLHGKDLDGKLQAIYSGRQVEMPKRDFVPVICARCSEKNTPGFRFCSRCGTPLGQGELVQSSKGGWPSTDWASLPKFGCVTFTSASLGYSYSDYGIYQYTSQGDDVQNVMENAPGTSPNCGSYITNVATGGVSSSNAFTTTWQSSQYTPVYNSGC